MTVTVTTDQLRELGENQKIKLRAYAWAEGYDDAEDYREIPLVAPAATDRVQISISATEVLVNEEVRIKVSPVNAEDTIKAVCFNDGYGFWDERRESRPEQDGDRFDRDGYFNVGQRWGSTGVFSVYAMVTFDDFGDDDYDEDGNDRRTWYTTETLPITVTKTGDLESPVFTLNKTRLGVDDMQNGIGTLTTVDHAESYWMEIERWFDEGETEGDFVCEEAGWYRHMSLALEPSELPEVHIHYADSFVNGTYRIMAGVDGEPGYMGCEANEGRAVVFAFRDPYLTEEEEAAAEELKAAADNLPENAGIPDEENVYALKETLDYLTDGQKAWLGGDEAVADIAGKINQAKEKVDQAKADAAAAAISALPEGAGLGEESSIQAARAAYDDLKPDQQAKIDANTVKKLTDAENKMQSEITAAEKVKSDIEALVNAGADDVEAAAAAQTALSALTPAQQAYLDGKYGEGTAQILSQKAAQAKEKAEAAKAEKAAAEKAADKAAAEEAARIAAAKAAFRLNVKANATVPVQLKKNVKKVKAVLGEGDAIASVTSSNAKFVKAGFSGTTITLKGLKNKKKAVITVTTKYGAQISFKVKVQKKAVKTKSIKVKKKFTVKVGETLDLGVLISPVTTLDKLTFKTSAKKAAAVSKAGIITAKKAGTAKITIKSGKKKKTVTVKITK